MDSPKNGVGGPNDGSPPDVKRPRRNSQGMADGNTPGAPTATQQVVNICWASRPLSRTLF
jgi:hypothetical protein